MAHPYAIPQSYVPPTSPRAQLGGGAQNAFLFYGPAYDVDVSGSGSFEGAIIGGEVDVSGVEFHFDEGLAVVEHLIQDQDRVRKYQRIAFREISWPTY